LPPVTGAELAHHLFTVILEEGVDRELFRAALTNAGVQTSIHYPPVHRFSHHHRDIELPKTDTYGARTVTLPMFPHMSADQLDIIVRAVLEALQHAPARVSDTVA
jgi:dTDP-4-amino-4,6-dideoxygalactose transaminase